MSYAQPVVATPDFEWSIALPENGIPLESYAPDWDGIAATRSAAAEAGSAVTVLLPGVDESGAPLMGSLAVAWMRVPQRTGLAELAPGFGGGKADRCEQVSGAGVSLLVQEPVHATAISVQALRRFTDTPWVVVVAAYLPGVADRETLRELAIEVALSIRPKSADGLAVNRPVADR
ncbi:hypothetical protein [Nocardia sp. NPDC058497]|uniref:hypothetical protein n=1 Tax=Nocardia sp. NPDC058497 TaxID=3346529 RepID=UPI003665C82B